VTWTYARWAVEHPLPVAPARHAASGTEVRAGDVIASGGTVAVVRLVDGARRVGVAPADLDRVLRVRPVADVRRGMLLARTGRRFARAATAPIDGRLVHVTADGDLCIAPVVADWRVRAAIDGVVTRSDAGAVTVEGSCWSLRGIAAYGPDGTGELSLAVDGPDDGLAPTRIDVRLRERILVGGARMAAEAITRAHACGVAGLVAGAAPAGGLRVVYGDDVEARGGASFDDRPTILCLQGFGWGPLPRPVWDGLVALAGHRASIHAASTRLYVMAPRDAAPEPSGTPLLALASDHSAVRPVEEADAGAQNVLPYDAER